MIELHTFRLRSGVGEDEFLEADRRARTEVAYLQPGFIRWTTARGQEPGSWAVLWLWGSMEAADAARTAMSEQPAGRGWWDLLEPASVVVSRWTELPG